MIQRGVNTAASLFGLLGIVFIPFPFNITHLQLVVTDKIWGPLLGFTASHFFGKSIADTRVYSDSTSMYLLLLVHFIFALLITLLLQAIQKWGVYRNLFYRICYRLFVYYLSLQLLKYGADKLFKNQFYIPEPNTLFTPLGAIEKDLLFWSTMGSSYGYNIFLGTTEAIAALLIFIPRTRLAGLLLSLGILINIVAINFSFDISVKLFSLFLLYLNLYLLFPYRNKLQGLVGWTQNNTLSSNSSPSIKPTFASYFVPWLAGGLICLEVFFPFVQSRRFNGDAMPYPYLHGAYQVTGLVDGTDTLPADVADVKRFFIHRNGYMIFEDQQKRMTDYKLAYDTAHAVLLLTDNLLQQIPHAFTYRAADSVLTVQYINKGKMVVLIGRAINWQQLPLLKKGFHWTSDAAQ